MIMGISVVQLKINRNEGHPLPHVREGGKILYRLEDVRNYLKAQTVFKDTRAVYVARRKANASSYLGVNLSVPDED